MPEALHSDAMRRLLRELVEAESPSGDIAGLTDVTERVADAVKRPGIWIRRHATDQGPLLEVGSGQGGALLLGHADTVWPRGTLAEMPWREEGDRVFGPGCLDMKAGLVLAVWAIRQAGDGVPFRLLVTPDEEVGSAASRAIIEDRARQASVVLVLEPGMPGGALKTARSGVGDFRLVVSGVESHAGLDPDRGASATLELARQVLWLAGLADRRLGTTVNVGTVRGGTRSNVVAGHAEARVDVRVAVDAEIGRIERALMSPPRFDERVRVQYTGAFDRPPLEPSAANQAWFERARRIWLELTGRELGGLRVGGASDGNFTARICPTLDGLGGVGEGAHARHEHVDWTFMPLRLALIVRLMQDAAGT